MKVLSLSDAVKQRLHKYNLEKKFNKQLRLLTENSRHPSLNTELLEPKKYGIYSFRIDIKFRALFVFHKKLNSLEIIAITKHYK